MRYANYLVKDENNAADIVQESFIKTFINLNGFDTNKNFQVGYIELYITRP